MTLLILGANGQLGQAFKTLLPSGAVFLDRNQADLSQPEKLPSILRHYAPRAVINAAAYTQVDKAESEEPLAFAVNGESPAVLAQYCKEQDIAFVHYSTDYVFDGSGNAPWREEDKTSPLNVYGRSKRLGEEKIEAVGGRYLIFRTSWVYDAHGKNFLNTMLKLGQERELLRIVADQHGAPTYAPHLAKATLVALQQNFAAGLYHLCGQGETSWFHFAEAIFEHARKAGAPLKIEKLEPIATKEYPTPAQRPLNSRLDCSKAERLLGIKLPSWQEGLADCMEIKYARN